MITWNQPPCDDPAFTTLLEALKCADPESLAYDELIIKMRALPVVAEAWARFREYVQWLLRKSGACEFSCCQELSLHGELPRWHNHVVFSCKKPPNFGGGRRTFTLHFDDLQIWGKWPVVRMNSAKGKTAENNVNRMHCYCQFEKIGQTFSDTNDKRGSDWVCKAAWVVHTWQLRKLSYREAKKEIVSNRDQVECTLTKIEGVKWAELEEHMRSERLKALALSKTKLAAFKTIAKVENEWKPQYVPENYGKMTRCKFLTLAGDSRFGKTRYACSLFGPERTYVVNCQGVKQPNLAGYDPRQHACIVLDEPSPELIDSCKVFLQASLDGADMYQSPTQRFTRWIWVYMKPIVICTNRWIKDTDESDRARWIRENEVYVEVTDFLFDKPQEELTFV